MCRLAFRLSFEYYDIYWHDIRRIKRKIAHDGKKKQFSIITKHIENIALIKKVFFARTHKPNPNS